MNANNPSGKTPANKVMEIRIPSFQNCHSIIKYCYTIPVLEQLKAFWSSFTKKSLWYSEKVVLRLRTRFVSLSDVSVWWRFMDVNLGWYKEPSSKALSLTYTTNTSPEIQCREQVLVTAFRNKVVNITNMLNIKFLSLMWCLHSWKNVQCTLTFENTLL